MKPFRLVPVLCLLAAPLPALADHMDCDNPLPQVLNLGLPRLPRAGFDPQDLKGEVERFMTEFYQEHGRCPGKRQLQVNITIASDYELLDWLSQGTIHAAVIPDMTLYLLKERDGVDLRKVEVRGHAVGDLLLPALSGVPLSTEVVNGRRRLRPSAQRDLEALYRQLWRLASKEAGKNEPVYRPVLASHLSTTGFLEPLLATARWLKPRLDLIADEKEREDRRESFWQEFFSQVSVTVRVPKRRGNGRSTPARKPRAPRERLGRGMSGSGTRSGDSCHARAPRARDERLMQCANAATLSSSGSRKARAPRAQEKPFARSPKRSS